MHILFAPFLFFVVACINTGIGSYVLLHQPSGKANQAFFVFSLGASMWIGGFGLLLLTHYSFFIPVLNLGGVFLLAGLFRLACVSSAIKVSFSRIFYIPFLFGAAIALYPGLLIERVSFTGMGAIPHQGPWFPYYSTGFALYALASIVILAFAYRSAAALERKRLHYFFLGIGIFIVATAVCDLALPAIGIFDFNFAGPLSSVISLSATAYAILRHRLMDIRIVLQRSLVYSILLGLIICFYVLLAMTFDFIFITSGDIDELMAGGVTTIVSSFTLPFIERFFRKVTDPIFFKDSYVYSVAVEKLGYVLNSNLNFDMLISQSLLELECILHPRYSYFVYAGTREWFSARGRISEDQRPLIDRSDDAICSMNVLSEEKILGEFILGPKRSGDIYTMEDCTLLRTFTNQAATALQKAELYRELQEHSAKLEEKVEERTLHLKELQSQQREFFDDISHALQTPLTVLKSALGLLAGGRTQPDTKVYDSMGTSVDNLSQLIRNMLELSRIGTTAVEAKFEVFDLSSSLSRILEYVGTIVHEQDILLSRDIECSLMVHGNSEQLDEVITNLLSNAVRYTENCPVRSIFVSLVKDEDMIVLTVRDTGVGMTSEQLTQLFDRFYRAESTRERAKGFGLGLAITKRIVASHDGTIEVESQVGIGTTFIVRLPHP